MKETPILFSTEMVQAILDGRKTQTRRVIKPQPEQTRAKGKQVELVADYCTGAPEHGQAYYWRNNGCWNSSEPFKFPYGQKGDVLWVRETICPIEQETGGFRYEYKASGYIPTKLLGEKWTPAIHMPKAACRIKLRITNIRVERLQDISLYDAINEGIENIGGGDPYAFKIYGQNNWGGAAVASFQSLWESINGSESWDANPWVWVIRFERVNV